MSRQQIVEIPANYLQTVSFVSSTLASTLQGWFFLENILQFYRVNIKFNTISKPLSPVIPAGPVAPVAPVAP